VGSEEARPGVASLVVDERERRKGVLRWCSSWVMAGEGDIMKDHMDITG
jgi:hypothetical protein